MAANYDVDFDWDHSHGHIVSLLVDNLSRGILLDVGCGYAPHAEPLRDEGFTYVGLDVDAAAVEALTSRGFIAHQLDLGDPYAIAPTLNAAVEEVRGDLDVAGILALDVIEHLVAPHETLAVITAWMQQHDVATLGVSIPNVSFEDLPLKLLNARWDVTPTGLLDATHLRFFTDSSLSAMMTSVGLAETARNDVPAPFSDQCWPANHPLLARSAALATLLRHVRELSDDHAHTHQFVRLFDLDPSIARRPSITPVAPTLGVAHEGPFLSILIHPSTSTADVETLTAALAEQSSDDFEIVSAAGVGSGGSAPDHDAIDEMTTRAAGVYLTIIDRHQRFEADWVEQFARASVPHGGAILRCGPALAQSDLDPSTYWPPMFELADHLVGQPTPSGAVAFPIEAIRSLRLSFNGHGLPEAHSMLIDLVPFCDLVDTQVTALTAFDGWRAADVAAGLELAIERVDSLPLLMGYGSGTMLAETQPLPDKLAESERTIAALEVRLAELEGWAAELSADNEWLNSELAAGPVKVLRRVTKRPSQRG